MNIGEALEAAIRDAALEERVRRLSDAEASLAVAAVKARFVADARKLWWWEGLRPEVRCVARRRAGGFMLLPAICPDAAAWLLPSDDEFDAVQWPVFLGTPTDLATVIGHCPAFEYVVADPRLEWLVIENHHDALFAAGEPVASALERLAE